MVSPANGRVETRPETYIPGYALREVYVNKGRFQCIRTPGIELMEEYLGENFEITKERGGKGRIKVWVGYHSEFDVRITVVQGDNVLKSVYVRYEGDDPDKDLSELRRILTEDAGLERVVSKGPDEFDWPERNG